MSRVRLVGVGPGHPGLATVQAVEAIKDADVIRNADGCGTGLLHLAPGNADIAPLESIDEVVRLARSGPRPDRRAGRACDERNTAHHRGPFRVDRIRPGHWR